MKFRSILYSALATLCIILLLGVGVGEYVSFRLEPSKEPPPNLYALIPPTAAAVFETDDLSSLVADIHKMQCSREGHFLYVSELFVYLKDYLQALLESTPHGLSSHMNKILISFHTPDHPFNQVLYCSLGMGDYELIEAYLRKQTPGAEPTRTRYRGEELLCYPLTNTHRLTLYLTREQLAVSFEEELIRQVIDARLDKQSLLGAPSFNIAHAGLRTNVPASVYVSMRNLSMGRAGASVVETNLGEWMEFDLQFDEEAVYCSATRPVSEQDRLDRYLRLLETALTPIEEMPMMADMQEVLQLPDEQARHIPSFFFRHADFFRHFLVGLQFNRTQQASYFYLVLLYRE
ncbi:MAG: hypothetical protein LBM06_08490 [Prevotellaceae bacterium]|jgi:hypothetical protein|nr:hypothetical protein [Prevotellaceae bacterium]